jgi:hypothetical protein
MPDDATRAGTHQIEKCENGNPPAGRAPPPTGIKAINKTGDAPPPPGYTAAELLASSGTYVRTGRRANNGGNLDKLGRFFGKGLPAKRGARRLV